MFVLRNGKLIETSEQSEKSESYIAKNTGEWRFLSNRCLVSFFTQKEKTSREKKAIIFGSVCFQEDKFYDTETVNCIG